MTIQRIYNTPSTALNRGHYGESTERVRRGYGEVSENQHFTGISLATRVTAAIPDTCSDTPINYTPQNAPIAPTPTMVRRTWRWVAVVAMLVLGFGQGAVAQTTAAAEADRIVGRYEGVQGGMKFNAVVSRMADGSYRGQIVWVEHDRDANGRKLTDSRNPNKALRNTPCDRIVLFSHLRYNADAHRWGSTTIYDPQRGINARLTAWLTPDGRLALKGSLLGISETVYWKRID